jgi:hypothetical protein
VKGEHCLYDLVGNGLYLDSMYVSLSESLCSFAWDCWEFCIFSIMPVCASYVNYTLGLVPESVLTQFKSFKYIRVGRAP